MRDLVVEVNSLRLPPCDGFCDPAEHDTVRIARGVEPGLARHRRSALCGGWSFPVPPLFHFVNNAPHYTETVEHLLAEMNLTQCT